MDETKCRKCGASASRSLQIAGIGPVCYTCFQNHKEKPFWEQLHNRLDPELKAKNKDPNQRTLNDISI